MPPPDPDPIDKARRVDWPAWLALVWALAFGLLYARMVVESRFQHTAGQRNPHAVSRHAQD